MPLRPAFRAAPGEVLCGHGSFTPEFTQICYPCPTASTWSAPLAPQRQNRTHGSNLPLHACETISWTDTMDCRFGRAATSSAQHDQAITTQVFPCSPQD